MNFRYFFDITFPVYAIAGITVFGIVSAVFVFALIRYRSGRGHDPSRNADHTRLELAYVFMLVCIGSGLTAFAVTENSHETAPLGKPALTVVITGFRWCWSFHYDGTPVTIVENCDPTIPVLVLPRGQIVKVELTSHDVVHEWWVPAFRWKEEAFPNHYNTFEMRTDTNGYWRGECTVFCGLFHFRMDFAVRVVSVGAFNTFLHAHGTPAGVVL